MDYEKAYTNAVSKIKTIIADKKKQGLTNCLFEGDLNEIFPELASDDERIREMLIRIYKKADMGSEIFGEGITYKQVIAWLEKQGEQNNIVEQLTAFAQHLNKRGAFRDNLCMDFEHEAQSFIEMQNNKEI